MKTSISLTALFLCIFFVSTVRAQELTEPKFPLAFTPPPAHRKPFEIDSVAGQVVVAPASERWVFDAGGVQIALFDAKQVLISTTESEAGGQFALKSVTPGDYTLIVGAKSLNTLSIPIHLHSSVGTQPSIGLMMYLRLATDTPKSYATPLTNMALRSELRERVANDQAIRNEWIKQGVDHPNKELTAKMATIDTQNTARMQEIVRQYGFPGPELVAVDGSEAAFVLVQHAVHSVQKTILPHIEKAFRAHKLSGNNYALFVDNVLAGDGKSQIYGTRARPIAAWKNHEPAFFPIADETHVDQRRAKIGLTPLAEYRAFLKKMYFPTDAPKEP